MRCGEYTLDFEKPLIMGILNVTPDSFSDSFLDVDKAVKHAKQMIQDGADIIDIGGESTRPGSDPVSEDEELKRVKPVVERLVKENIILSIDSYKPRVVEECLKLGVHIVNDITGLRNDEMIRIVSQYRVPVVIMHMLKEPKIMQQDINYKDVVEDIKSYLGDRVVKAKEAGIEDIIIDPGIGFGKTTEHNLQILKRLKEFNFGYPILIGASRKSFIGNITNMPVDQRLEGTLAAVTAAVLNGASILRVHDVKECKQAIQIADAIKNA